MRAVDTIRAKRDGEVLTRGAIDAFVAGVMDGSWQDYQISALLMAVVLRGMNPDETAWLTDAMVRSGRRLDLSAVPGPTVGKHSTGGVGDKVSIVLAPLVAACGVIVPKMSGRGLGHTGGTLDKLESIPGFRVSLTVDELLTTLTDVGCCLVSQTGDIAPADKKLYSLRDVTATIESIPLIAASVMSKKLAEGSRALVLDVKCGAGAFMKSSDEARALARALVAIGTAHGVRTEAFITAMDTPLGRAVGNALEIAECVDALHGRGPSDLEALVVRLAIRMLQIGGRAMSDVDAEAAVRSALQSGEAVGRFGRLVAQQGGDAGIVDHPDRLPRARYRQAILSPAGGFVSRLDAERIGRASMMLGAGREKVTDAVDPAAGILLHRKPGEAVDAGEPLMELHYNEAARLRDAAALAESAVGIAATPPTAAPLVLGWVHDGGETMFA